MCNIAFLPIYVTGHKLTSSGRCPSAFLCIVHWCNLLCSTLFHVKRCCVYASQHAVVLSLIHISSPSLWRQRQLTAHSLLTWHNVATMVLVTAGHLWSQTWFWLTACWNCCIQHERANCCEAGTARRCQSESQFTFCEQHCNWNHMKGAMHVIAWCAGWQRTLRFKYEDSVSEFSPSFCRPHGSL